MVSRRATLKFLSPDHIMPDLITDSTHQSVPLTILPKPKKKLKQYWTIRSVPSQSSSTSSGSSNSIQSPSKFDSQSLPIRVDNLQRKINTSVVKDTPHKCVYVSVAVMSKYWIILKLNRNLFLDEWTPRYNPISEIINQEHTLPKSSKSIPAISEGELRV